MTTDDLHVYARQYADALLRYSETWEKVKRAEATTETLNVHGQLAHDAHDRLRVAAMGLAYRQGRSNAKD